jgi:hypothetical protein
MASSSRALLLAVAAVLGTAHGASYTVGALNGSWDLQTNYDSWAAGINFRAGDDLGICNAIPLLRSTNIFYM